MKYSYIPAAKRKASAMRVLSVTAPDDVILANPDALTPWADDTAYAAGECVSYEGQYYRCLTAHTSNAEANWIPGVPGSLWAQIGNPADEWPEWIQPSGANPYPLGTKVSHIGKHWKSIVENNVWEPGVYGWEEQP